MSPFLIGILIWLSGVNLISIIVTIYDKHCSKINRWRVSEKSLLLLSILGGSPGMYLTMKLIRHKTQKKKFMLGLPLIFFLEALALVGWICWNLQSF